MNCWEQLGLESDADERTIKRRYARLLKTTRPDEDPQAFQVLREVYEQALRLAALRRDDSDAWSGIEMASAVASMADPVEEPDLSRVSQPEVQAGSDVGPVLERLPGDEAQSFLYGAV